MKPITNQAIYDLLYKTIQGVTHNHNPQALEDALNLECELNSDLEEHNSYNHIASNELIYTVVHLANELL